MNERSTSLKISGPLLSKIFHESYCNEGYCGGMLFGEVLTITKNEITDSDHRTSEHSTICEYNISYNRCWSLFWLYRRKWFYGHFCTHWRGRLNTDHDMSMNFNTDVYVDEFVQLLGLIRHITLCSEEMDFDIPSQAWMTGRSLHNIYIVILPGWGLKTSILLIMSVVSHSRNWNPWLNGLETTDHKLCNINNDWMLHVYTTSLSIA